MRHLLETSLVGAAFALGACSSDPPLQLYNPRTGMVATCDVNRAVVMSQTANDRCAREYEQQGYVRRPAPQPR